MMGPINGPISHSNTCKFHTFKGPFDILMGPSGNLMGQRVLYMHLRAKLMLYLNSLYIWNPAKIKPILA